jgi:septum site-determining protein MinC
MSKNLSSKPIEIKISTVVAVSAILRSLDLPTLEAALKQMTGGMPDYFDNELVVLDVAACPTEERIDWAALIALFKAANLNPVAVRGAVEALHAEIVACGLSIDTLAKPRADDETSAPVQVAPIPAPVPAPVPVPVPTPAAAVPAMIVDTPVRAGQRIYARGCDLVVTAVVNGGAELIADGCIHVYAPLRGRALAGASGNVEARIFTLSMEAELVSIAGTYRTFEGGLPQDIAKKAAQIRLAGDRIEVLSIRD